MPRQQPLPPGQRTFMRIPDLRPAPPSVPPPPMTSRQIKKAHREATRMPKVSREERRRNELAEQARIRKEIEQEQAARRAQAARERKKAKEEAKKEEKRRNGKPLVDVRPSQGLIERFVRGNGTGKKRSENGAAVDALHSVAEDTEPQQAASPTNEIVTEESEKNEMAQGKTEPEENQEDSPPTSQNKSRRTDRMASPHDGSSTLQEDHQKENPSTQEQCSAEVRMNPSTKAAETRPSNQMNQTTMDDSKIDLPANNAEHETEKVTVEDDLDDKNITALLRDLSPDIEELVSGKKTDGTAPAAQHEDPVPDETTVVPTKHQPSAEDDFEIPLLDVSELDTLIAPYDGLAPSTPKDMESGSAIPIPSPPPATFPIPLLDGDELDSLIAPFDGLSSSTPKPSPTKPKDMAIDSANPLPLLPLVAGEPDCQPMDEFSSFSIDDLDEGMLRQLDRTQQEIHPEPIQESTTKPQDHSPAEPKSLGKMSDTQASHHLPESCVASPAPSQQQQQQQQQQQPAPPPMSTQAVLLNLDDYFPSPSQAELELECQASPLSTPHTPCPPPRGIRDDTNVGTEPEASRPEQSQPTKRFFSASGSNELLSLALHRSRRTAALEDIQEHERQRTEAGLLEARQRSMTDGQRSPSKPTTAPVANTSPQHYLRYMRPRPVSSIESISSCRTLTDHPTRRPGPLRPFRSHTTAARVTKKQTTTTREGSTSNETHSPAGKSAGKPQSHGKENEHTEDLDTLLNASQETDFGGDWIDQEALNFTINDL